MNGIRRLLNATVIRAVLVAAVVVFLGLYLRGLDYSQLSGIQVRPSYAVGSALFALSFRFWGVVIWRTILADLGSKKRLPPFTELVSIYARSWMARYIPGSVTWIASKVFLARRLGISKSRLTVASLVEAGSQVVAVAAVSLVLISTDPQLTASIDSRLQLLVAGVGFCGLVMLVPSVFNRVLRIGYKVTKRSEPPAELATNGKTTLRSFLLYMAGSLLSGLSHFLLVAAIWPETGLNNLVFIVGAMNLAGVIGMATPLVPSGFGTKDASQLVLLSLVMPAEIALTVTVFSRLWTAVMDVSFYLVAMVLNRAKPDVVEAKVGDGAAMTADHSGT